MKNRKAKANLMVDESFVGKICDYALLKKTDSVLEIGAGTGNLTTELLDRCGKVYALEKDRGFVTRLEDRFMQAKNLEIIQGNALKVPFPETDKIVSNLPYDISKKITEKILNHNFILAVLVYQKEFADKLAAKPGSENYRFISALTQSCAKVEVLDTIPPNAFNPQPKVSSAIVRLTPSRVAEEDYILFLRRLFNQKNKKISKVLKQDDLGALGERRAYTLPPETLLSIYYGRKQNQ